MHVTQFRIPKNQTIFDRIDINPKELVLSGNGIDLDLTLQEAGRFEMKRYVGFSLPSMKVSFNLEYNQPRHYDWADTFKKKGWQGGFKIPQNDLSFKYIMVDDHEYVIMCRDDGLVIVIADIAIVVKYIDQDNYRLTGQFSKNGSYTWSFDSKDLYK